jgi:4-hydroxybenzoate polyprenyltransferase
MKKILKFLMTEIIYNGHLQALGAVGIVYISSLTAFGIIPGIDLLILVYCVFQFIYYFDRYRDINKDESTNKTRSAHLKVYVNKVPLIMALLFLIVVLGNVIFGNIISLISSLIVMFLGALYPIYFKGLTKKIFMFKNFYVAFVHALLGFYPLVYYPNNTLKSGILYILFLFVLIEVIFAQIALDTKDIKSDKKDKLLTFPVIFGKNKSVNFIKITSIFSFVFLFYISFQYKLGLPFYMVLLGSFIINEYIAYKIKKERIIGVLIAAAKFFILLCLSLIINIIL